jgi:hypothetical protein
VLEMRVRVLRELVCLHHHDKVSAELEVSITSVDSWPNRHIGNSGDGVVTECLGHD